MSEEDESEPRLLRLFRRIGVGLFLLASAYVFGSGPALRWADGSMNRGRLVYSIYDPLFRMTARGPCDNLLTPYLTLWRELPSPGSEAHPEHAIR